jgi:23S rRNA (uridine2552-2'-O)-methyltransferase
MKRTASKKNKLWQDHYTRRAKKEHFPARSVYKLQEIQQKHELIKKGYKVLDLGCAPGSWLLYAAKLTGDQGRVVGIDLKPVTGRVPSNAQIISADGFALGKGSAAGRILCLQDFSWIRFRAVFRHRQNKF